MVTAETKGMRVQPNLKCINEHQQCGFQRRKALNPKGVIVFNPEVAGVLLRFVASRQNLSVL